MGGGRPLCSWKRLETSSWCLDPKVLSLGLYVQYVLPHYLRRKLITQTLQLGWGSEVVSVPDLPWLSRALPSEASSLDYILLPSKDTISLTPRPCMIHFCLSSLPSGGSPLLRMLVLQPHASSFRLQIAPSCIRACAYVLFSLWNISVGTSPNSTLYKEPS